MNKREYQRLEKRFEKSKARLELLCNPAYMYKEDNIERIKMFKYYSGFDDYKNKRVVRSISISNKLDNFITDIQKQAKEKGNFISKDIIINIALYKLFEEKQEKHIDNFNDWIRTYLK